jgi:hypothetical protein
MTTDKYNIFTNSTVVIVICLTVISIVAILTMNKELALVTASALISYLIGRYHNRRGKR